MKASMTGFSVGTRIIVISRDLDGKVEHRLIFLDLPRPDQP